MRARQIHYSLCLLALLFAVPNRIFGQTVLNGDLESGAPGGAPESWKMWPGSHASSALNNTKDGSRCLQGMMTPVDQTILCGGTTMLSGINPSGGEFKSISVMVYIPSSSKNISYIALGIDQNKNRNLDPEELGFQPAPQQRDEWVKIEMKEPEKLKVGPNTGAIEVAVLGIGNVAGESIFFDDLHVAVEGGANMQTPKSPFEPPKKTPTPVPTPSKFGTTYAIGGAPPAQGYFQRQGAGQPRGKGQGAPNPSSGDASGGDVNWMGARGNDGGRAARGPNPGQSSSAAGKPWRMTWNAVEDFGAQQGESNWVYREWNGKEYKNLTWSSADKAWVGEPIGANKSGATNQVRIEKGKMRPSRFDSALTWIAKRPGTIAITGTARKFNISTGDGVFVGILKNDKQVLWEKTLEFNDGHGFSHALNVPVQPQDTIVFRVNQREHSGADMVEWSPKIAYMN